MNKKRKSIKRTPKNAKKINIRKQIIDAALIYSSLTGKVFLYVYDEEYFQVSFRAESFSHLTGVLTSLSAVDFYRKAKAAKLTDKQFYFNPPVHPIGMAKKKLPSLQRLPELTTSMVTVLKDLTTQTMVYKIGITNLEFTLGLTENLDSHGNRINDYFIPRTLRVEKISVEKSVDAHVVDFIFMRNANEKRFNILTYDNKNKSIPKSIEALIDPGFYQLEMKYI